MPMTTLTTETTTMQTAAATTTFNADRRARILATQPGKRWFLGGKKSNRWLGVAQEDDAAVANRQASAVGLGRWRVAASFPTEEGMGDDPGSRMCECPWSMESHAHWQGYYEGADQAIAAAEQCWTAMQAGRSLRTVAGMVRL